MRAKQVTPEEQATYDNARSRIEECRRGKWTFLILSMRRLTSLPPEIGQLSSVTQLYLSDNQLTVLPPEIGQLSSLTWLALDNNQLTALPPELNKLSRLTHLFLHWNPALELPPEVLGPEWNEVFGIQKANPASPQAILDYYFTHHPPKPQTPPTQPTPQPASQPAARGYDVFISAKSEDYPHARMALKFLTEAGLRVFFSDVELPRMGAADYYAAIDDALETATHMLVVTSSREFADSRWVRKEWQTFLHEKLSGRKDGELLTLLCQGLPREKLPLSLRQFQTCSQADLAGLLHYFRK